MNHPTALTPIRAQYAGYQNGYGSLAGYELWTILDPRGLPGTVHPFESSLARPTIEAAGYTPVESEPQ